MTGRLTPPMSATKAHYTAAATAAVAVIMAMMENDAPLLRSSMTELLTVAAGIVIPAAVAWLVAYQTKNKLL